MPLDLNNNQFLTESQIREKASSIFTATAAPGTSEKYSHISTDRIINDILDDLSQFLIYKDGEFKVGEVKNETE